MTETEPTSGTESVPAQSAPLLDTNANADVTAESTPEDDVKATSPGPNDQKSPGKEGTDASKSRSANGKDGAKRGNSSKPGTPRDKGKKNGRERERDNKDRDKDEEKGEKEKDDDGQAAEGKPTPTKRTEPYVNEERVKTGGPQREKPSDEELAARMERIRLNNEKIKERRAAVQADEQAFQASQAAERAKNAAQRKIQTGIDEKRAINAKRKMERVAVREWDSFKKGVGAGPGSGGGTNASMYAPGNTLTAGDEGTTEDQAEWGGEFERGRGRGRGAGRGARARGQRGVRGGGRGRGGFEGQRTSDIKDEKSDDKDDTGGWGTGAEVWGSATNVDTPQTGVAITTNDPDPWGAVPADDPWGAPSTTAPAVEEEKS
ncbi:uncharacterized protein FOMMEDRAFT_139277 [Fomitiporia mediterranea MF3/22]|uniref:uncharacterized protein n=1 Tax=Fomitiporia mediterranea (strain MF3/22) TaxID=694068 RepID=UPI0004407956|nr:uncharacterized protein FOMMEDRAFT_139277 [Fomitiporia mediterranea MF3/22]EJD05976.1 hypothetical protein FOMMEDRAFT_139277 [Fomitiporia mediterranea MF3/22]